MGAAGNDTLEGLGGHDIIDGGFGADSMDGGTGNDTYTVDNIGDVIVESTATTAGLDTVKSKLASYTLADGLEKLIILKTDGAKGVGNEAANSLTGAAGKDTLEGLGGNDTILGGLGDDFILGGAGLDQLTGGAGADRFVLDAPIGTSFDKITDFASLASGASVVDKLAINGADYGLTAGALDASRFVNGTTATSAAGVGQFVYNSTTKKLYWDADGSGGGAMVEVANFSTGVNLSANDFLVM